MLFSKKSIPENQAEIIVCAHNFHGRTITIVGFSTDENSRSGFGPFTPGFKIIPFGDAEALEQAINELGIQEEPLTAEDEAAIAAAGE